MTYEISLQNTVRMLHVEGDINKNNSKEFPYPRIKWASQKRLLSKSDTDTVYLFIYYFDENSFLCAVFLSFLEVLWAF